MVINKIIKEVASNINGKITVVKTLGLGTYFQVDGLTQSGGVVELVWKHTLKRVHNRKLDVQNVLILGLGGGSVAKVVRKYWPKAKITGVEIDLVMVVLGTKYLGLEKTKTKIEVKDAQKAVAEYALGTRRFDLVLVDLYIGYDVPLQFTTVGFLKQIKSILEESGMVVFNRLYFAEKRSETVKFGYILEKVFDQVEYFYPEANIMFICRINL